MDDQMDRTDRRTLCGGHIDALNVIKLFFMYFLQHTLVLVQLMHRKYDYSFQ